MQNLWISILVGVSWAVAQPRQGRAQVTGPTPSDLLRVGDRPNAFSEHIETLLRADRWESWRDGWRLARDVGPAMAPGLWHRLRQQRGRGRLVLLGAFGAAAGATGHRHLLDPAWIQRTDKLDRLMALLVAALAPPTASRHAPATAHPPLPRLIQGNESSVRIAAAVALGRTAPLPPAPQWFANHRNDPGLAAAALLAGARLPAAIERRWFDQPANDERSGLVWRAALLSPHDVGDLRLARRALSGGGPDSVLRAAALWLARRASPEAREDLLDRVEQTGIPAELTALLASDEKTRRTALHRGLLGATPSPRLDRDLRLRMTVLFALAATPAHLAAAADAWREAPELATAACLTLACRAFAGDRVPSTSTEILSLAATARGGRWLRAASDADGDTLRTLRNGAGDEALSRAWRAHVDGRLPPTGAIHALEDALWRMGAHPASPRRTEELTLVGDLLLAGSDYARSQRGGGPSFPYLPDDLQPDNRRFFEVAVEFYRWTVEERDQRVPEALRLRW